MNHKSNKIDMPDVDEKLKACPDPMSNENQIVKLSGCESGPFVRLTFCRGTHLDLAQEAPRKRTREDGDEVVPTVATVQTACAHCGEELLGVSQDDHYDTCVSEAGMERRAELIQTKVARIEDLQKKMDASEVVLSELYIEQCGILGIVPLQSKVQGQSMSLHDGAAVDSSLENSAGVLEAIAEASQTACAHCGKDLLGVSQFDHMIRCFSRAGIQRQQDLLDSLEAKLKAQEETKRNIFDRLKVVKEQLKIFKH